MLLSLGILLTLAIPSMALSLPQGKEEGSAERVRLQPRLLSIDRLELPDPPWRLAGEAIELGDGGRYALSTEGERVRVDLDGDGDLDLSLRGTGDGSVARLRTGARGGVYPVRLRLSPSDGEWEWAPIGGVRGRVRGSTVTIVDLSGNGRYDDYGFDAVLLGGDRHASYLSRVLPIDGELVELELAADGRSAAIRTWQGATGLVDARAGFRSGGQLESVILRDGPFVFDLGRARGGLRIPAGEYELVRGRMSADGRSVRIEQGGMSPWIVTPDRPLVPEWGGPLTARCEAFFEADVLHVLLFTLAAEGRAGERYVSFQPRQSRPAIRVGDASSGRAFEPVEYITDQYGGWGVFLVQVDDTPQIEIDLRYDLPLFGPTAVEVVENPGWKRRDLGL